MQVDMSHSSLQWALSGKATKDFQKNLIFSEIPNFEKHFQLTDMTPWMPEKLSQFKGDLFNMDSQYSLLSPMLNHKNFKVLILPLFCSKMRKKWCKWRELSCYGERTSWWSQRRPSTTVVCCQYHNLQHLQQCRKSCKLVRIKTLQQSIRIQTVQCSKITSCLPLYDILL